MQKSNTTEVILAKGVHISRKKIHSSFSEVLLELYEIIILEFAPFLILDINNR